MLAVAFTVVLRAYSSLIDYTWPAYCGACNGCKLRWLYSSAYCGAESTQPLMDRAVVLRAHSLL